MLDRPVVLKRSEISSMQRETLSGLVQWEIVLSFTPISNKVNVMIQSQNSFLEHKPNVGNDRGPDRLRTRPGIDFFPGPGRDNQNN